MAIQITRQPNEISWSRNPILFEFFTDQVVQDYGRKLIFILDFTSVENDATIIITDFENTYVMYEDWSFTLSIGQTVLPFSCEYGQTPGKFRIPHRIAEPLEPKTAWLERVKTAMLQAFNVGSLFSINVDEQTLVFTSKKNDSSLEVSLDAEAFPHPLLGIEQTAVDITYTPNLKIYVEMFAFDLEGNEQSVVSAALAPGLDGKAFWDFSSPLTAFVLDNGPDRPSLYDVVFGKGKVIRSFFIQVTELYGEPQVARMSLRSGSFAAIFGGLPKNLIGTSLVDSLKVDDKVKFLTTSRTKKVTPDQPQWISWLNVSASLSDIKVIVELVYNDGTPYIFEVHSFDLVVKYGKIIIPIGLDQIGANTLYPELSVVSYSVYLQSEGKQLSETITYSVDNRYLPYKRFFLFQNSQGSFETFYTYGKKSNSLEFEKDSARIIQVKDFVLENGENVDIDLTSQEKEKVNTGFKSKAEIKAMRDFYLSKDKLTYVDGKWWPVNLSSSSIEEIQDGNGLYAQSFEISGQHLQELFYEN
ncbi:hypothetical protein OHD16_21365 [Sphingobacterium sp. ML3W]|uniref:hypothetical protein n=1 Tax=Sphingobacterium sp. ML3W TaxID=1538644 RepID=UPI00249AE9C1|nr:hypothetical protein [Sphingobacterium sp. ML3W]WFA77281.1 hypothetical protein OGI71_14505 [Sphingobacterium sp. ML3W]